MTVYSPPGFTVSIRTPVGASFGLIGGAIAAGEINEKSAEFTKAVAAQGFSVQQALTEQLKADLEAEGYAVDLVPATRSGDSFLRSYPQGSGGEAWLDVVVKDHSVGYRAAGNKTSYYPYVLVSAQLVGPGGGVLYSQQLVYNPIHPPKNARTIAPSGEYAYANFDQLMADPARATAGLKQAVAQIAAAIAADLK
ncbi:MAG TPA: hypothetical protein VFX38_07585 [Gammaproteobacteria bacterium]|nr:hypothetical protein [Gammaproteobacteria bacterium]